MSFPMTKIRNANGSLSKALTLDGGKLVKTAAADLVRGFGETVTLGSLRGLAALIADLRHTEALTFGVTNYADSVITTQKRSKGDFNAPYNLVCRDRAHFNWPQGAGVLMLDIDQPKDGSAPMKAKAFDALLCELLPWWQAAGRFYRPSVSAFVYDANGNELTGAGSLRCYAIADRGENIPHIGLAITDALWKAGRGRIEFSASGSLLVRCPVDGSVWQPERLDFAGPAVLGPGLTQKTYPPLFFDGGEIDSEAAIAGGPGKIAFSQWRAASPDVKAAQWAARPEEAQRRRSYIAGKVKADVAAGADEKQSRRKWYSAARENILKAEFQVQFRDKGAVTVADILADPSKFDGERCADPNDPDAYGADSRIAQFYANTGKSQPYIFSHSHGGVKYSLSR